jgi:hypothetical protein
VESLPPLESISVSVSSSLSLLPLPSLSSPTPFIFEGDELAPVATVCDVASDFDWRFGLPVLYASSICCFLIYVGAGAYYDSLATRAGHRSVLYILTADFWRNACCMRPRSQAYMVSVDRTVRSHACVDAVQSVATSKGVAVVRGCFLGRARGRHCWRDG